MSPENVTRALLVYQPLALVAASLLFGVSAASAGILLVVLYLASLVARWWPGFTAVSVASFIALPVVLWPHVGPWSVLAALPLLPAMGRGLTGLAPSLMTTSTTSRRTLSPLCVSLCVALAALVLVALTVSSIALAAGAGVALAVVFGLSAVAFVQLGSQPLGTEPRRVSVRAGERVEVPAKLQPARRQVRGYVRLSGEGDARVDDTGPFPLHDTGRRVVALTPTLAGPREVALHLSITDQLGLIHVSRRVVVTRLNVVPRARVARWAAEEFAERGRSGPAMGTAISGQAAQFLATQSGVEYASSRLYVSGDRLQSIDWKHSARLQRLVVKTFDDGSRLPGLLLANLSGTGAEEVDRLVYEFLSAALTVSSLGYGAAIAVCNHRGEHRLSPVLDGRALVRRALEDLSLVRTAPAWRWETRPMSAQETERRAVRAERAAGAAALGVARLLRLRQRSLQADAEGASMGLLAREAIRTEQPDWCIVISAMHGDAEAVLTTLGWMKQRGMRTRLVDVGMAGSQSR